MDKANIINKLSQHGYRPTRARIEIVDALLTSHGHLTADDLYEQMRGDGSNIGRMTVFRTLDLLAEIGVVRPTYGGSGAAQFVLLEDGHHHHMVCMRCNETTEFEECTLADDLSKQLADQFKFKIEGHLLEIYGVCSNCQ